MEQLLLSWLVLSVIVFLTAAIVPGFSVRGLGGVLVVAAAFGILNHYVGRFLYSAIGLGTMGVVVAFVIRTLIDAGVLKLVDALSDRLTIASFGQALLAAVVMSGLGTLAEMALRNM